MTPLGIIRKIIATLDDQVAHHYWAIANGCGTSGRLDDVDPTTKVIVILVVVAVIAHGWPYPTV